MNEEEPVPGRLNPLTDAQIRQEEIRQQEAAALDADWEAKRRRGDKDANHYMMSIMGLCIFGILFWASPKSFLVPLGVLVVVAAIGFGIYLAVSPKGRERFFAKTTSNDEMLDSWGYASEEHRERVHEAMARRMGFRGRRKMGDFVADYFRVESFQHWTQFEQAVRRVASENNHMWDLDADPDDVPIPPLPASFWIRLGLKAALGLAALVVLFMMMN